MTGGRDVGPFGPYEVLGEVASGSTGTVFRARQPELDRIVAIKEIAAAVRAVPGMLDRFRSEAQMLASLDDPHVVAVYDYVEEDDRAWIAEEWVTGVSLGALLVAHGTLTPEQSVGVIRGGLLGLAHAHDRGLVHRDIAPSNLLLDTEGTSKLVDFGIAAPIGSTGGCGTPAYVSPEVARGDAVGPTADIYSTAAVLYFLLAGAPPFSAGDPVSMLARHINDEPPELPGHGPDLAGLLRRAMAKDPAARPADARAFLAELEEAAERRFGAGWLERASVAALVTSALGAAGTGVAAMTPSAAGETVMITSGATDTGPGVVTTVAKKSRRGLLVGGGVIAGLIAIGVGVAVASGGGGGGDDTDATDVVPVVSTTPSTDTITPLESPGVILTGLPDGRYTWKQTTTATTSPREEVGGSFTGPGTLTMSCGAATCTGTLVLDAGVTFKLRYDGSTLAYRFTNTRTLPNEDTNGQPIDGHSVQRQQTRGELTQSSPSGPLAYTGTSHTVVKLLEYTGDSQPEGTGPWFTDTDVSLTQGETAPRTTRTPTSPTPASTETAGPNDNPGLTPQPGSA